MKKIFLFACLFSFSVILFAQVDVAVTGKKGNDTLLFRGFQGSEDMRRQVEKDLRNCGWFDVQRGGVTTFIISGRSSGTSLELTLSDGAGVKIASIRAYGNTIPEASHKAVDGVLKHLYRVEGLCDTRIAFTAQRRRCGSGTRMDSRVQVRLLLPVTDSCFSVWLHGHVQLHQISY